MGAAGRNSVCQDLSAGHFEPLPTFSISFRFLVVEPYRFPCNPCEVKLEWRLLRGNPQCWGRWTSTLGSFPTGGTKPMNTSWYGAVLAWGQGNIVNM